MSSDSLPLECLWEPGKLEFFVIKVLFEFQIGDGTNLVLVFSGALLDAAEELLRMVKNGS